MNFQSYIKSLSILLLTILFYPQVVQADICQSDFLESMPILRSGRVKPLMVHANESLSYLTKTSRLSMSPVKTYCYLSLKDTYQSDIKIDIRIDHSKVKEFLGIPKNQSWEDASKLVMKGMILQSEIGRLTAQDSYKKSLEQLLSQLILYRNITSGMDWVIPSVLTPNEETSKKTLDQVQWSALSELITSLGPNLTQEQLKDKLIQSANHYTKIVSDKHLLEVTYSKLHLASISMFLVLLSLFISIALKSYQVAVISALVPLVAQTILIVLRIMISGRAPITNMYETVLFSGYGGLILAMIIGHVKKDKILIIVGLSYNLMTLMMMTFAKDMVSSDINPLVPVLRDNFWLSTHVTSLILSYGALALSWVLANLILIRSKINPMTLSEVAHYSDLIHTCLKYGTVLLAAGVILGGIWADYSWGRFWGWDPKETWSLIVLFIYMAILHGKYTSWIPPHRFIFLTAAAFMSVMMAWFGVNYILASGLHSYGFSQGGAFFLAAFFTIQVVILILTAGRGLPKQKSSSTE